MKHLIQLAALAAVLAGTGAAQAATARGTFDVDVSTITAIDMHFDKLSLADGKTYQLPAGYNFSALKLGEKVAVWFHDDKGGLNAEIVDRVM